MNRTVLPQPPPLTTNTIPYSTGKGDVEFKKGHYHDGLYVKKNNLVLALVETSSGVSPPFLRHVGRLQPCTGAPAPRALWTALTTRTGRCA